MTNLLFSTIKWIKYNFQRTTTHAGHFATWCICLQRARLLTRFFLAFVHLIAVHRNISKNAKDPQRSSKYQNGSPVHALKRQKMWLVIVCGAILKRKVHHKMKFPSLIIPLLSQWIVTLNFVVRKTLLEFLGKTALQHSPNWTNWKTARWFPTACRA